jgi:protein tyrosine phosphatase (PTP) superfamily phosphohydrolase (DUF442 family)
MKAIRQKVLLALSALILGTFIFRPVSVSAGPFESLRAQDPIVDLNLTALLSNNSSDIPAVSVPAPVLDPAAEKAAANPLPNFAQVTPNLYRSGQPTQAGIAKIKSSGIKTILKLNADVPAETSWAASAGLKLETVLMSNQQSPTYDQVDAALVIINDPSKQPVLVHCHLGHDRTGAVIGAYRVTVQVHGLQRPQLSGHHNLSAGIRRAHAAKGGPSGLIGLCGQASGTSPGDAGQARHHG